MGLADDLFKIEEAHLRRVVKLGPENFSFRMNRDEFHDHLGQVKKVLDKYKGSSMGLKSGISLSFPTKIKAEMAMNDLKNYFDDLTDAEIDQLDKNESLADRVLGEAHLRRITPKLFGTQYGFHMKTSEFNKYRGELRAILMMHYGTAHETESAGWSLNFPTYAKAEAAMNDIKKLSAGQAVSPQDPEPDNADGEDELW